MTKVQYYSRAGNKGCKVALHTNGYEICFYDKTTRALYEGTGDDQKVYTNLLNNGYQALNYEVKLFSKGIISQQLRYQVSHAAKKAGLGHVRVHDLRQSFAVNFLNNEGKLHDLQILMGHSSIKTIQRYMKFKKEEVAQKMIGMNDMFLGMTM